MIDRSNNYFGVNGTPNTHRRIIRVDNNDMKNEMRRNVCYSFSRECLVFTVKVMMYNLHVLVPCCTVYSDTLVYSVHCTLYSVSVHYIIMYRNVEISTPNTCWFSE